MGRIISQQSPTESNNAVLLQNQFLYMRTILMTSFVNSPLWDIITTLNLLSDHVYWPYRFSWVSPIRWNMLLPQVLQILAIHNVRTTSLYWLKTFCSATETFSIVYCFNIIHCFGWLFSQYGTHNEPHKGFLWVFKFQDN